MGTARGAGLNWRLSYDSRVDVEDWASSLRSTTPFRCYLSPVHEPKHRRGVTSDGNKIGGWFVMFLIGVFLWMAVLCASLRVLQRRGKDKFKFAFGFTTPEEPKPETQSAPVPLSRGNEATEMALTHVSHV